VTPEALLGRLGQLGVAVRLCGPGWIALAPADRVPDDLRPEVVAHKAKLAALLGVRATDPRPDPIAGAPRPDLPGSDLWARLLDVAVSGPQRCERPPGALRRPARLALLWGRAGAPRRPLAAGRDHQPVRAAVDLA